VGDPLEAIGAPVPWASYRADIEAVCPPSAPSGQSEPIA
jgi:hypothetical protein